MITTTAANLKENLAKIPESNRLISILVPGKKYYQTIENLIEFIAAKRDSFWAYIAVTKPFESIIRRYRNISSAGNIRYIDCISQAAGTVRKDDRCSFVDSPTMLEHISMELEDIMQRVPTGYAKHAIVDSLTTLTIYNDEEMVIEFFYHLINKTGRLNTQIISVLIMEEPPEKFIDRILHMSDTIIKIITEETPEEKPPSQNAKPELEKEEDEKKMDNWYKDRKIFTEDAI